MSGARVLGTVALAACVVTSLGLSQAVAQTAQQGKNLSALSPENLQKPRPKPPFDMTGTWGFSPAVNAKTGRHLFLPLPCQRRLGSPTTEQRLGQWMANALPLLPWQRTALALRSSMTL